jgi:predicted Rdx family selenoprotein
VSAEIEKASGEQVELIAGGGGIFEIRRDGELLWKKQRSGHFPNPGEAALLFSDSTD